MKALEALKDIMENQEVTITQLADRLGKTRSAVSNKLLGIQKTITTEKLNEFLRVLDYKIVIMPQDARLPKDSYEVE